MFLGIEEDRHLVFEGTHLWDGRGLWPVPMITPASIRAAASREPAEGLPQKNVPLLVNATTIFREDFFDPVTRIRRGRFYKKENAQMWEASPHPALNLGVMSSYGPTIEVYKRLVNASTGLIRIGQLLTFQSFPFSHLFRDSRIHNANVELGFRESPTFWRVIDAEPISTGEELVTLKARGSFGAMPEIESNKIDDIDDRSKVVETIEKLVDTIHRAGPESVVDNARNAASAILLAALRQHGKDVRGKDLGDAIKEFEKHPHLGKLGIVLSTARIVARLHSRTKPSEQERREHIPAIREQDAELAVLCVGTILRDLGWANWS